MVFEIFNMAFTTLLLGIILYFVLSFFDLPLSKEQRIKSLESRIEKLEAKS